MLESFWRAQQSRDWFLNHPILSDPDLCQNLLCAECFFVVSFVILSEHVCSIAHKDVDLSLVFPILCHGDDAESHRRRSFTVTTISSPLMGGKSPWDQGFLVYVMDVNHSLPETIETLDAWVVYGLVELQTGQFMTVDVYGQPCERKFSGPVCGPYRGVLYALKGEQKFLQKALKLTTSWTSEKCCMYCGATASGQLVYSAFGEGAPHPSTPQTTLGFITDGCLPNPWVRVPGFDLSMVLTDWLHLVDLAITPEASASAA